MTHSSILLSPRRMSFIASMCATFVFITLLACGSSSASDLPVEVVDASADGAVGVVGPIVDITDGGMQAPLLVEVSGRTVEVVEGGVGGVTVVFESGLGNDWSSWDEVARKVAASARVFAYSRPGYGQSDASPAPRTATRIVEDLRALLAARHVSPPYVLVGHSFGGAYMELFAKAHPDEVVGVVLVDPRHRDFTAACQAAKLEGCTIPADVVASLPEVQHDEFEAFAKTSAEIRAAGSFGPYPVRVLTATSHGFGPDVETLWESMLKSLASEAVDGKQLLFRGAGHLLQLERPHDVADAILSVLAAANT